MNLKLIFYTLLLLLGFQNLDAQVTITTINCTKISAQYVGPTPCIACWEQPCGIGMMANYMELQEKQGNAFVTINTKQGLHHTFNLVAGKTYRVIASVVAMLPPNCITTTCPKTQQEATYCIGIRSNIASPEHYAAAPIPKGYILDVYGEPLNDCIGYVPNQSIWLDARASIGESAYRVQILRTSTIPTAWNSAGWVSGEAGLIDLREVWRTNTNWDLWPDTYVVSMFVKNSCATWVPLAPITFNIYHPIYNPYSPCRTGNFESAPISINLFPNPASYEITLEGVEDMEGDVEYFIQDFSGKMVSKGRITNPTMPIGVSDLVNGMYVINIVSENNRATKKFTIVK